MKEQTVNISINKYDELKAYEAVIKNDKLAIERIGYYHSGENSFFFLDKEAAIQSVLIEKDEIISDLRMKNDTLRKENYYIRKQNERLKSNRPWYKFW